VIRQFIEQVFPELRNTGYSICSPATIDYNCIVWAATNTKKWWWPDTDYFWPNGVEQTATIEAFVEAFETLGYGLCEAAECEAGYEKVAIYVDSQDIPAHAARQLDSGLWTSKSGESVDIEHTLGGGWRARSTVRLQ
jgi:hypothetical protein